MPQFQVTITKGQYAGQEVLVASPAQAAEEFGIDGFKDLKLVELYQVILHHPVDGDVVWENGLTQKEARAAVVALSKQGRSAEYIEQENGID